MGLVLRRLRTFEEYVALHPDLQASVVVLAQISLANKDIVVVAVVAVGVVVQPCDFSGMGLMERRLACVVGIHSN
jgi:hypothetical protein